MIPEEKLKTMIKESIKDAISESMTESNCLVGWTRADVEAVSRLRVVMAEKTVHDWQDVFDIVANIRRIRDTVGNIFMAVFFGGAIIYGLSRMFPSVFRMP